MSSTVNQAAAVDVLAVIDLAAGMLRDSLSERERDVSKALMAARSAIAAVLDAADAATATLSHAYHTVLTGKLAEMAHADYQRLDAAIARISGGGE